MIAAAMIVGPGEADRHLIAMLAAAGMWADVVVTVADHVEPKTRQALDDAQQYVPLHVNGILDDPELPSFATDESYVRNALMSLLDGVLSAGDLVVVLDADEELDAPRRPMRALLEGLLADDAHDGWLADFYHLWAPDGALYRRDGGWAPAPQLRIYRHVPGARMEHRVMACQAVPALPSERIGRAPLAFLHWGYARPKDRKAKHARYMQLDAGRFHSRAHLESIVSTPELAPFPPDG